jgi:adenylylsulfate kinase-like enzyme
MHTSIKRIDMKKILIMGLPGAGKTYLAQYVLETLQNECKKVGWLNADDVRKKYKDWDFSHERIWNKILWGKK